MGDYVVRLYLTGLKEISALLTLTDVFPPTAHSNQLLQWCKQ